MFWDRIPDKDPIYTDYETNRRQITFGNVLHKNLMLGPAERADIIIDFSGCPVGSKLIFYNDGPAPIPALDTRYDLFPNTFDYTTDTGNPFGASGGVAQTQVGFGPNTRTFMQFQVVARTGAADPYTASTDLAALNTQLPNAFAASQPPPLIPTDTAHYGRIDNDYATGYYNYWKDINEQFDNWGRMNATLANQNLTPTGQVIGGIPVLGTQGAYADPPTEILTNQAVQVWKFVHNGVDTHFIHFHLFNLQVINRSDQIGGVISGPDPNERGWKETIRMNPLEVIWVAIKPKLPTGLPFPVPHSIRPLNPSMPLGAIGLRGRILNRYAGQHYAGFC